MNIKFISVPLVVLAMVCSSFASSDDESGSADGGSSSSATGFYVGADVGVSHLKAKLSRKKIPANSSEKKGSDSDEQSKGKSGLLFDVFAGYKFQVSRIIFGAECTMCMETAKPETEIKVDDTTKDRSSVKRRYNFGFVPKIGCVLFDGFNAYVNFGASVGRYIVKHQRVANDSTKQSSDEVKKSKASLIVGLGAEQSFGSIFVRAECNKMFGSEVAEVKDTKTKTDSYVFKVGAGYKF